MGTEKTTKTPQATVIGQFHEGSRLLSLPYNNHYAICETGSLPAELGFPQKIPRVYAVVGVEKSGAHAHMPDTEQEIMFCVAGKAMVYLWNKNGEHFQINLMPAKEGNFFWAVYVPCGVWHTVRYAPGTALIVVASTIYDRSYYLEDPTTYFTEEGLRRYQETFPE